MADQVVPISAKSAKEIQKGLDAIKNKPTKRKITGLRLRDGNPPELVIVHSPAD